MVEKAIYYRLIDPDNATDVVALTAQRVYPQIVPQHGGTMPYIVYFREPGTIRKRLTSGTSTKLPQAVIKVCCWAEKNDTALDLGAAVIAALDDMHGTINTINVHKVEVVDEYDGQFEFETEGREKPVYVRVIVLSCWYRE